MRILLIVSTLLLATGCVSSRKPHGDEVTAFNVQSSDVVSAAAEHIDPSFVHTREGMPHFEAQLHLVLNDAGVRRLQQFIQAFGGEAFELRVNGEVLLAGVGASQFRGAVPREGRFFVATMNEAEHFAASLKNPAKRSSANKLFG